MYSIFAYPAIRKITWRWVCWCMDGESWFGACPVFSLPCLSFNCVPPFSHLLDRFLLNYTRRGGVNFYSSNITFTVAHFVPNVRHFAICTQQLKLCPHQVTNVFLGYLSSSNFHNLLLHIAKKRMSRCIIKTREYYQHIIFSFRNRISKCNHLISIQRHWVTYKEMMTIQRSRI